MTQPKRDWIYLLPKGSSLAALSPRQKQVLELIAQGYRIAGIAHTLGLKPETVNQHVIKLRRKLGAKTNAHAVALEIEKYYLKSYQYF